MLWLRPVLQQAFLNRRCALLTMISLVVEITSFGCCTPNTTTKSLSVNSSVRFI